MINGLSVVSPYGWRVFAVGEKVVLSPGDTLVINVSVSYKGPAQTLTLYGAIGNRGATWFDEMLFGRNPLNCPESAAFTLLESSVAIPIPANTPAVTDYDVYVKLEERPDVKDFVDNVIDVTAAPGFLSQTMGMLLMVLPLMMMGMMAPMFSEEEEAAAEEATPKKEEKGEGVS
jgi:hypothetical protein